ncbi:MAG: TldD/PmbA family protein [Actinomycetota bacterium]
MSEGLLETAHGIVERARRGEQLEAFLTHERTFQVKAFDGGIESLSSAEPRGAGVRIVVEGRAGLAHTTDLSPDGLDDVVGRARMNVALATPDDAVVLPEPSADPPSEIPGLADPAHRSISPDEKIAFVLTLERAARTGDPRVRTVEDALYADSEAVVAVASSTGISGTFVRTDAWCYAVAIVADDHDTQTGFELDLGRSLGALDADDVARRAVDSGLRVLGGRKIPSATMPVVFDPYTAAQFLGVIGEVLTGEAVQKGRSVFAGRLGQRVGAGHLTLFDDGRLEEAPGSAPWDGEGVPTRRTEVIRDGVLAALLYDTKTARRDGRSSTGNAARSGHRSLPHPAPSNMALATTGEDRDEVLRRAGRALWVHDFHGVHSGANPITGDFSVGVTGSLLDGGEVVHPVKEVTIAAPLLDILGGIEAVATDLRWIPSGGSFAGATTLVAEMTVGGA